MKRWLLAFITPYVYYDRLKMFGIRYWYREFRDTLKVGVILFRCEFGFYIEFP